MAGLFPSSRKHILHLDQPLDQPIIVLYFHAKGQFWWKMLALIQEFLLSFPHEFGGLIMVSVFVCGDSVYWS